LRGNMKKGEERGMIEKAKLKLEIGERIKLDL
jgi:hypothetical protein